jgi:hypothetical protein
MVSVSFNRVLPSAYDCDFLYKNMTGTLSNAKTSVIGIVPYGSLRIQRLFAIPLRKTWAARAIENCSAAFATWTCHAKKPAHPRRIGTTPYFLRRNVHFLQVGPSKVVADRRYIPRVFHSVALSRKKGQKPALTRDQAKYMLHFLMIGEVFQIFPFGEVEYCLSSSSPQACPSSCTTTLMHAFPNIADSSAGQPKKAFKPAMEKGVTA